MRTIPKKVLILGVFCGGLSHPLHAMKKALIDKQIQRACALWGVNAQRGFKNDAELAELRILLSNPLAARSTNDRGQTFLHVAALFNKSECIDILLGEKSILDLQDMYGNT